MRNSIYNSIHAVIILLTLAACGGGGGGDDDAGDAGDAGSSSGTYSSDNTATDESSDGLDGTEASAPKYAGFDFDFHQGDYWEYRWDDYDYTWAQDGSRSTTRSNGRFRITLGSARDINGVTAYEVQLSGYADENDSFYQSDYQYIAIKNNVLLGSKDGTSLVTIFDAENGYWTGGGFFKNLPASLIVATNGTISNDYITSSAIMVGRSDSQSQCEIIAGITFCGDDSSSYDEKEYYAPNVGPLGYYYEYIYSFGGIYSSGGTRRKNVGLVASSLRGDTVDYVLEAEPNNSMYAAQSIDDPAKVIGFIKRDDPGAVEYQVGTNANNPDQIVADWYEITIPPSNGNLAVYKTFDLTFPGTNADLDLYLFMSNRQKIAESTKDNVGTGSYVEEIASMPLYPGTYYIGIHAWSTTKDSEYTLSIR